MSAPGARAHRLAPRLQVVHAGRQEHRHRADDDQVVEVPAAVHADPLPLAVVDHVAAAVREHAGRTRVDHQHPRAAEVAVARPPRRRRVAVGLTRVRPQRLADVLAGRGPRVQLLLVELGRRQVPQVLVDPVRHERAGDAAVPPRLAAGILDPLPGDVPVVDHVVIVEHHHARHGRQQPADVGVGPRLAVEAGVLLEVGDLLAGRLRHVAAAADELQRLGTHLVRVDLVADQQQPVRPRLDAGPQPPGVRPQGVDAEALVVLIRRQRVRLALRRADPARPEHQPRLVLALTGADHARRMLVVGRRPDLLAVELDLVLDHLALGQVVEHDQRVVMSLDLERRGRSAGRRDRARRVRLDPDGCLRPPHVAEQRAEDERCHGGRFYVRPHTERLSRS